MPRTARPLTQSPHSPQDSLGRVAVEPLPAEFEAELQVLDALLQASAARTPIPRHLADAIYDMTVGLLWPRQVGLVVSTRRLTLRRLAMAASILLALLVAARLMPSGPAGAGDAPMLVDASWSPEVEEILLDMPIGPDDARYLSETRELSLDELHGDLLNVLDGLKGM